MKKPVEFGLIKSLIERLAYEDGVVASCTKSEDKMFPYLVNIVIAEEVALEKKRTGLTCKVAKIEYRFEMAYGASISTITALFPVMLRKARSEAFGPIRARLSTALPSII